MAERQIGLFQAGPPVPPGFTHRDEFISGAAETRLLQQIALLPLQEARYRQWTAKRRTISFGGVYDFTHHQLNPAPPLPEFLLPLREQLARWVGLDATSLAHASIAEYRPGTELGWHRDVPDFEVVAGVSLRGAARMRFRHYPPATGGRTAFAIDLQPRSAYIIRDIARWRWQHAISPTKELRYSITFRTLRGMRTAGANSRM